jgi:uncharacterized protein (TIGR02453 family)
MTDPTRFAGFPPAAFAWFEGLEADNSRDYVERTRDVLDGPVRGQMELLLDALAGEEFGHAIKLFRQHRDLRFARDKSPYKTRTYGLVHGGAHPYYAELSARGLYAGSGFYRPERDQLGRFRDAVLDEATGPELEALVADVRAAGLEVAGATLRSAPRGVPRDHPRVALLRHTSLIVGRRLAPGSRGIGRQAALGHLANTWRAAAPVLGWVDRTVGRPAAG